MTYLRQVRDEVLERLEVDDVVITEMRDIAPRHDDTRPGDRGVV